MGKSIFGLPSRLVKVLFALFVTFGLTANIRQVTTVSSFGGDAETSSHASLPRVLSDTRNNTPQETPSLNTTNSPKTKRDNGPPVFYKYNKIFTWPIKTSREAPDDLPYQILCGWRDHVKKQVKQQYIRQARWKKVSRSRSLTQEPQRLTGNRDVRPVWLIHVQLKCQEIQERSSLGTGSWLQMLYLMRLVAVGTVTNFHTNSVLIDIFISCTDNDSITAQQLVLPWMTGHFSSMETRRRLKNFWGNHTINERCSSSSWNSSPVGWMVPIIRDDLRAMAIALVGLPTDDPSHPVHEWVLNRAKQKFKIQQRPYREYSRRVLPTETLPYNKPFSQLASQARTKPLLPNVELDEVAIHFRCGDIMASDDIGFRFIKFKEIADRIYPNATSIGIVTQPLDGANVTNFQARGKDIDDTFRVSTCQTILGHFRSYLEEKFPDSRVRIHQGADETVALSYARLIMASKQSFAAADSSFSVFPVLASFAKGYHMVPRQTVHLSTNYENYVPNNQWLLNIKSALMKRDAITDHFPGDIEFMDVPPGNCLDVIQTKDMHLKNATQASEAILKYFTDDDFLIESSAMPTHTFQDVMEQNDTMNSLTTTDWRYQPAAKEESLDSRPTIKFSKFYNYSLVVKWHIEPDIEDFDKTPYRQFCRWRNNLLKGIREQISKAEKWEVAYPPDRSRIPRKSVDEKPYWLIHMQFDCQDTLQKSPFGTGNWVQLFYLLRLAAAGTFNRRVEVPAVVDFMMTCTEDEKAMNGEGLESSKQSEIAKGLVMPWIGGHFSSSKTLRYLREYWKGSSPEQRCQETEWGSTPVGWMIPFLRHDFRRLALGLVGLPQNDPTHPAYDWVKQVQANEKESRENPRAPSSFYTEATLPDKEYSMSIAKLTSLDYTPLIPHVEIDDAVIHFRCGDIMSSSHVHFRFLKFKEFTTRIDPKVRSIGIVTQSFGMDNGSGMTVDSQARKRDNDDDFRVKVCRKVVTNFVLYLQKHFPTARVSIRNGPEETVALAYARLIMARQAFAWPDSSFSVFPVLASFGTGYHMVPNKTPYETAAPKNQWLKDIQWEILDRDEGDSYIDGKIQFMDIGKKDALYAPQTQQMRSKNATQAEFDIVEWFSNDKLRFDPDVIGWQEAQESRFD